MLNPYPIGYEKKDRRNESKIGIHSFIMTYRASLKPPVNALSIMAIALGQFEKDKVEKVLTELAQDPFEQVAQTAQDILSKMD